MAKIKIGTSPIPPAQVQAQTLEPATIIKEVPVEVIKEVIREVIREVPVEVIKEVIKEVPVEVVRTVEVIKLVPHEIIKKIEIPVIKELHHVKFSYKLPRWSIVLMVLQFVIITVLMLNKQI